MKQIQFSFKAALLKTIVPLFSLIQINSWFNPVKKQTNMIQIQNSSAEQCHYLA